MKGRSATVDDFFKFKWLRGAALSGDGGTAVYAVSTVADGMDGTQASTVGRKGWRNKYDSAGRSRQAAGECTTLFRLDLSSGEIRQLTSGGCRDTEPRFSPDATLLAFTSDRSGKSQIYLMPLDGGEALPLTDFPRGAAHPVWSPDGAHIAFTAGVDYGEEGPPDRSSQPYRVTRNVWRYNDFGDLDLAVAHIYVLNVVTHEVRPLTTGQTVDYDPKWSPDGQKILFSSKMAPDRFEGIYGSLGIVTLGGKVERYLEGWGIGSKAWCHDGRSVVVVGAENDGGLAVHQDLYVLDLNGGRLENRAATLERALQGWLDVRAPTLLLHLLADLWVTQDDSTAYARVQNGGRMQICRIALSGKESTEVVIDGDRCCILLDMAAEKLLFSADDIGHPPELYVARSDGGGERRLTHLNDDLMSQLRIGRCIRLSCEGAGGEPVEGWYVEPGNGARAPFPSVLWIHGGPFGAQGYSFGFDTLLLSGAGFGVMFVNYHGSSGYGNAFSTAPVGDWGNMECADLMAGIDAAVAAGLADPDRLGVCGNSFGGFLSCTLVGKTRRFKAAIPQNALTDWQSLYGTSDIGVWFSVRELGGHPHEVPDVYRRCSPITYAHTCRTPTLLVQCEHDWRCPPGQAEQFYTVLKANGCVVEMLRLPESSHLGTLAGPLPVRSAYLEAMLEWFSRHLNEA